MRFFRFKLSSISTDLMSYEEPVMTLPAQFFFSVAFHRYPTRGNSNQSRVVQVNCIRLPARVQSHTKGLILLRAPIPAHTFTQCESQK